MLIALGLCPRAINTLSGGWFSHRCKCQLDPSFGDLTITYNTSTMYISVIVSNNLFQGRISGTIQLYSLSRFAREHKFTVSCCPPQDGSQLWLKVSEGRRESVSEGRRESVSERGRKSVNEGGKESVSEGGKVWVREGKFEWGIGKGEWESFYQHSPIPVT